MTNVRLMTACDERLLVGLIELLIDSVHSGASIGFLAPLSQQTAALYWDHTCASIGQNFSLWVAEVDGKVVGSVQLAACAKKNGRHRAEVQKLLVHSAYRGRGIAGELMRVAEAVAGSKGYTLLVLDTEVGSTAESIYQHLGWQKVGEIPNYASRPDGRLIATAYYYKLTGR